MTILSARPRRRAVLAAAAALLASPAIVHAAPVTFTDALARNVTLKAPPQRIVVGFNFEEFTAVAGADGWQRVIGMSRSLWECWRCGRTC